MKFIVFLICAYVIYRVIKAILNKKTNEPPSVSEKSIESTTVPSTYNRHIPKILESIKEKPAKWYGPGDSIQIGDFILSGFVYVGESLKGAYDYGDDACLINPKLEIRYADPWEGGEEMRYWAHYAHISPRCRGAYLKWLSTGRSTPNAYIGYVFLFFYGLERRLFRDGQTKNSITEKERNAIVEEVSRLLSIYQENHSFRGYANNLLAMEWIMYRREKPIPDYLDFSDNYYRSDYFQVLLAQYVASKKPLPSSVALQWLALRPDFRLRTPARRCHQEFKELFAFKYQGCFGEGIVVPPNKKKLVISYHAASPSLRGFEMDFHDLPDPFMLTAPLKRLNVIAEACTTDLDAYSRYLGRSGSDPSSLTALLLLPKELLSLSPRAKKITSLLNKVVTDDTGLIKIQELYEVLGEDTPEKIDRKEAENLAILLEKFEFGVVPDVRYYGIKPEKNSYVTIFLHGHGIDFKPSTEFHIVSSMMRLGAIVSQIDGNVSPHEKLVLEEFIKNNGHLTLIEKNSLYAYLLWSLHTPQSTAGLKQRLADIDDKGKIAVSRILVSIVLADGYIHKNEITELEKIYKFLGLDKSQVSRDLHVHASVDDPVTVALRDPESSFTIRKPQTVTEPSFSLNEELIRIREQETQQVRNVLENIFIDATDEHDSVVLTEASSSKNNPLDNLDETHQIFFKRLLEHENWERSILYELCQELGLMADGAMEVLNEWAFENANVPLIEDGDPIYVDIELAKEIIDVR